MRRPSRKGRQRDLAITNLDVGREEGELQRPAELNARGDHAGEYELGRAYASAAARRLVVRCLVLGRSVRGMGGGAVEVDELHFSVAEVAVRQAYGRDATAAATAGVHGGRQIWGPCWLGWGP